MPTEFPFATNITFAVRILLLKILPNYSPVTRILSVNLLSSYLDICFIVVPFLVNENTKLDVSNDSINYASLGVRPRTNRQSIITKRVTVMSVVNCKYIGIWWLVFRFSKDLYLIMTQKLTLRISLRISWNLVDFTWNLVDFLWNPLKSAVLHQIYHINMGFHRV